MAFIAPGRLSTSGRYVRGSMASLHATGFVVLAGTSCRDLAENVSRRVDVRLCGGIVSKDSSNETHVDITESVRGKDVFIIQSGYGEALVNDLLMETLIMCYACHTSSSRKIIGVIPYLPYSKQCYMKRRSCITVKLIASMLAKAGITHLLTVDLYHKEIQGFFDFPVDNLRASPFLIRHIKENIPGYKNAVCVARYPGVTRRANSFAEQLHVSLAVMHEVPKEQDDGRHSPPPLNTSVDVTTKLSTSIEDPDEKPILNLVGDVDGRIAILIDDVIDEVEPVLSAACCLKERGATKVYLVATHGIMSDSSPEQLESSCIDQILVTNTIAQDVHQKQCSKLKTIDISSMLAEAIRRIYHGESMSFLFKNVPIYD